jgi:hypothetical protein
MEDVACQQPFTPLRQPQNGPFSPKDCFLGYSGCSDKGRFANLESLPLLGSGCTNGREPRPPEDMKITTFGGFGTSVEIEMWRRTREEARPSSREGIAPALALPWRMLPSRRPQGVIWDGHIGQRYTRAAGQHCRWSRVLTWRAPRKSNRLIYVPRLSEGQARAVSSQAHAH